MYWLYSHITFLTFLGQNDPNSLRFNNGNLSIHIIFDFLCSIVSDDADDVISTNSDKAISGANITEFLALPGGNLTTYHCFQSIITNIWDILYI